MYALTIQFLSHFHINFFLKLSVPHLPQTLINELNVMDGRDGGLGEFTPIEKGSPSIECH